MSPRPRSRNAPATLARVAACALVLAPAAVRAEDRAADAERLFREAQKLLELRDYANACPKLEKVYEKDRQLGTLINLAFCHKEQETYWLAWLEFREAELKAIELGRNDRRDFVRQQMAEIEKKGRLTRVVVDNPKKMPLTEVLVEDRRVPEAERGATFMVEPTTATDRKLTFRAKGKKSVDVLVPLPRSEKTVQRVVVPLMEDQPDPPPPPPAEAVVKPAPVEPAPRGGGAAEEPRASGTGQRVLGYGLLGLGVVGIGVGSYFGIETLGNACAGSNAPPCDDAARSKADDTALVSTVAIAAGATAAAGGLLLLLTAPSDTPRANAARVRPGVQPLLGATWAGVHGRF